MLVLGKEIGIGNKNANGEVTSLVVDGVEMTRLAENLPKDILEYFRDLPRISTRSNGSPKVAFDGAEVLLGYWATNEKEKEMYKSGRSGSSGTRTSSPKSEVRDELLTFAETLKGEDQAKLKALVDKLIPDPELSKAQKMISGLSEDQLKALKALLG